MHTREAENDPSHGRLRRRRSAPSRVIVALVAAAVLLSGAVAGCGDETGAVTTGKNGRQKVTMGLAVTGVVFASTYVAKEAGYFADEGLDVELRPFKGGSALQAAFASGDIQMADIGVPSVVRANAAGGQEIKYVMSFQAGVPYDVIATSRVNSWDDLRGKAAAVSKPGGQTDLIMRALLQQHGLDPEKDVTIIGTGGDVEQAAALKAGSADATVVSAGSDHLQKSSNAHILQASEDIATPMQTNGLGISQSFLDEHPDVAKKVVRALMRAAAAMHDPSQEETVKKALEVGTGQHDEAALQEWWNYVSSDPERVFPVTGEISEDGVDNTIKLVAENEPKAAGMTFDDVADPSLIESQAKLAKSLDKR